MNHAELLAFNRGVEAAYICARFRRVEYREEAMPVDCLPLSSYLRLPAVFGDGCLFGHHVAFGYDPALAARMTGEDTPEKVAARLADAEVTAPPGADRHRMSKVEWQLLGYVGKTPMQVADPNAYATEPLGRSSHFGASTFTPPARAAGDRR